MLLINNQNCNNFKQHKISLIHHISSDTIRIEKSGSSEEIKMARTGITYFEVEKAATKLTGLNKNPTIENIRHDLGTGSSSTIAKYLRQWKDKQNDTQQIASKEKITEILVELMKGLWERVCSEAQESIKLIKDESASDMTAIKQTLQQALETNKTFEQKHHHSQQIISQLTNDKLSLEQAIIKLQNDITELKADNNSALLRISDKQEQIEELKHLNNQVQTNLEHYREISREQRLKDQQQYESQIKQLEQSNHHYLQAVSDLKKQNQTTIDQYEKIHQEYRASENTNRELSEKFRITHTQLNETKNKLSESMKLIDENKLQAQALDERSKTQEKIMLDAQQQVAVLTSQLKITEKQLIDAQNQNKTLAHDKWMLGQEKAQLIGQLKHAPHFSNHKHLNINQEVV